jgi:predicted DNA-binding protein (UPF0251 family)
MNAKKHNEIKNKVKEIMKNPIIRLFYSEKKSNVKGSKEWTNITQVQLETLVIDLITDELYPELNYEERGKIRGVTKRSFYRTLEQARMNLIRAIFTIMVAAVLNIIDSPRLSNFNNLSQTFMDLIEVNKVEDQTPEEKEKWIKVYTKIIFEKTEELKKQTALNKPK